MPIGTWSVPSSKCLTSNRANLGGSVQDARLLRGDRQAWREAYVSNVLEGKTHDFAASLYSLPRVPHSCRSERTGWRWLLRVDEWACGRHSRPPATSAEAPTNPPPCPSRVRFDHERIGTRCGTVLDRKTKRRRPPRPSAPTWSTRTATSSVLWNRLVRAAPRPVPTHAGTWRSQPAVAGQPSMPFRKHRQLNQDVSQTFHAGRMISGGRWATAGFAESVESNPEASGHRWPRRVLPRGCEWVLAARRLAWRTSPGSRSST